jgi:hypothetical protein
MIEVYHPEVPVLDVEDRKIERTKGGINKQRLTLLNASRRTRSRDSKRIHQVDPMTKLSRHI